MNRKKRSSSDLEWRSRSGRSGRSVEGVGLLDLTWIGDNSRFDSSGLVEGKRRSRSGRSGLKFIEGEGVGLTWSGGTEEV